MSEKRELWVEQSGVIFLRGVKCDRCGSVLFPPQAYGCEACGADETHLREFLFPSSGTLNSFTTVHVHPKLETPYKVAEVKTEARQLVRGRLEHEHPSVGEAVMGAVEVIDGTPQFIFVVPSEVEA